MASEIEIESFAIIASEIDLSTHPADEAEVIARVIHATADFEFAKSMKFSTGAVSLLSKAILEGLPIVTDVQMVRVASSIPETLCALDFPFSHQGSKTKSYSAMSHAIELYGEDAIYVIGNAPTALFALLEKSVKLADLKVVAMPVGFVGAAEAKLQLSSSKLCFITNVGRKGGSAATSAAVNALGLLTQGELRLGPLQ